MTVYSRVWLNSTEQVWVGYTRRKVKPYVIPDKGGRAYFTLIAQGYGKVILVKGAGESYTSQRGHGKALLDREGRRR